MHTGFPDASCPTILLILLFFIDIKDGYSLKTIMIEIQEKILLLDRQDEWQQINKGLVGEIEATL